MRARAQPPAPLLSARSMKKKARHYNRSSLFAVSEEEKARLADELDTELKRRRLRTYLQVLRRESPSSALIRL